MSVSNPNQPQDSASDIDPVTLRRQRDCKRHPAGNITTPGCPTQCAFCGMSLAAQEQHAAEQAAWSSWQAASQAAFGAITGGAIAGGGKKSYP